MVYWGLRDYSVDGQIGLESHPNLWIEKMVVVCREVRRVLKKTGSMYLNVGDTYFGGKGQSGRKDHNLEQRRAEGRTLQKREWTLMNQDAPQDICKQDGGWLQPKQLLLMPSRLAIALQDDGWILRNDIIWHKPNHMPSSVKDRLTNSYEHIFHFVQARRYYYDLDAIRKPHKQSSKQRAKYGESKPRLIDKSGFSMSHSSKGFNVYLSEHGINLNSRGKNPGDTIKTKTGYAIGREHSGYFDKDGTPRFNLLGKNPGDFLNIPTHPFPEAHFAVYPEKICRAPIKASCPQWICRKCGKPRKRKTKTTYNIEGGVNPKKEKNDPTGFSYTGTDRKFRGSISVETVGWSDCGCGAGFVPGVVLDPMCGSGTTLVVAHKLGRRWIGIDLKPEYCEMARKRLEKVGAYTQKLGAYM